MADTEFLLSLLQEGRVQDFNEERPKQLDLSNADLAETDLSGANFAHAKLCQADLSGATLIDADLNGCNLEGADLSDAKFGNLKVANANFRGASLDNIEAHRAGFTHVDFSGSTWSGTGVRDCDFESCRFDGAEFSSNYIHKYNHFDDCSPIELFDDLPDEIFEELPSTEPDFLAPKLFSKKIEYAVVRAYQVEFSAEMTDAILRHLAREGNAEAIATHKLSLRQFQDRLYLGTSVRKLSPLTQWIRFDLVKNTFYRSTEVQAGSVNFLKKVAIPIAERFRGDIDISFQKKGKETSFVHLEDGRQTPRQIAYLPPTRRSRTPAPTNLVSEDVDAEEDLNEGFMLDTEDEI